MCLHTFVHPILYTIYNKRNGYKNYMNGYLASETAFSASLIENSEKLQ